jgi:CheY-like chemotaxis protein/two-component sensor histidine kinase
VFEQIDIQLSQAISTLIELMLPKSMQKNIRLSSKIDPKIPDLLIGDPTRLNQILLNLVSNAIKFTEEGEIKIIIELLEEKEETVELLFSVKDTGIGIPKGKLHTIFEGFTQATNDTTRKYGGTGLGLTIVKQLVEQQGGNITVESEEGAGSNFSFKLTFKKGCETKRKKLNEEKTSPVKKVDDLNVLLVEDNYLNQVLATKVLTNWNWKVDVAENGAVAVNKLQKNNYDIILMDIQMPEMDGYEATRYIRKKMSPPKSTIPIMAMTAHAISGEIERCEQVGMNGYISKPFNEDHLYEKILTILNLDNTMEDNTNAGTQMNEGRYTDLTYLKKLSKGDDDFVKQMISIFINQTPTAIQKMEADLSNKDWTSLRAVAHKMKPSFSFVGVTSLQEKIETIEDNAEKGTNANLIADLIAQVKEVSLKAVAELQTEHETK